MVSGSASTADDLGQEDETRYGVEELHAESAGCRRLRPGRTPMQARNLSTSETARILVIQVNTQGEPMMYKAE